MRILSTPSAAAGLPAESRRRLRGVTGLVSGVALCAAIGILSLWLCRMPAIQVHGVSALVLAMAIGMAAGNTVFDRIAPACSPGVSFAKQKLLRLGIILYGTRLTFQDIALVGTAGVLIDVLMVVSTFFLALLVGRKLLKLDRDTVVLIGAGSSICGAAAVLATAPVLKARADQATVAVATVVIFGTLATFLYPLLYRLAAHWTMLPGSAAAFGIYAGSTIHEVAQVIAAARAADAAAVDAAVISKMVRVMLLCPFLAAVSIHVSLKEKLAPATSGHRSAGIQKAAVLLKAVPWFAVCFVAVIALNSLAPVPAPLAARIEEFDTLLLAMAMAALGLTTQLAVFRLAGPGPILLAAALFSWLVIGGAAINQLVPKAL